MKVRAGFPFNYDQGDVSKKTGLECKDKSLTLQSQAAEADINTILKRFGVTGQLPMPERLPVFQDFAEIFDFRTALDQVREAQRLFMQVPADVRGRFQNDPQRFVEFCSDPANQDELVKLGLAPARVDPDAELVKEVEREDRKDKIRAKAKAKADPSEGGSASASGGKSGG